MHARRCSSDAYLLLNNHGPCTTIPKAPFTSAGHNFVLQPPTWLHTRSMFGIKLSEIAIISVFVALAFGVLFLPKAYGPYLQYLGIATAVFMLARWLFRRWKSSQ